ncbi:hypothetical protein Z043_126126, partial [Scleropages formosus]
YGVSGNDHTLTIKNVSQHEEGIITCEAKTEEGIVKCQFDTTVTSKRANAPSFLVQPKSQNVNEGQNVIFTCEITGDPTPEIEWLKNNVLVCLSSKLKLSRSKNVYTLEIKEASISDSGKYTVKAKNMYGQCSATASLNVLGSPAKIEALPEDICIEKGKVLTISCAFSGDPVPEIEWTRSGRTLPSAEDSGRFHVETAEDLTTLIIT